MIIEVAGVSTRNKGAELMLIAIRQHFLALRAKVDLAVDPWFGTYSERAGYGLRTKLVSRRTGRSAIAMRFMPPSFRRAYGLVAESDIDAVLDASGFAFGDQLGRERAVAFARDVRRWKQRRKPVILLPQALGPFQDPQIRGAFADVVSRADLIYARDRLSYEHCRELGSEGRNIRLGPDFTNQVVGALPVDFDPPERMACVVPNHRMVEKADAGDQKRYVPFLAQSITALRHRGLEPVLLLHDTSADESLVNPIQDELTERVPVIRETDPRRLKGILGCAHVVLGSRYHALVGALSQAVPCIGIGWSHKYAMLFEDYGCPECLLSVSTTAGQLERVMDRAVEGADRTELVSRLQEASQEQNRRTSALWSEVDSSLGLVLPPALDRSSPCSLDGGSRNGDLSRACRRDV